MTPATQEARITIRFSCPRCGLKDEPVVVRGRRRDEDLLQWTNAEVIPAISYRHTLKSLLCETQQLTDIKVPCGEVGDPDSWVGKASSVAEGEKP